MASPAGTGVNIPKTCNFAFYMEFNTAKLYFPSKLLQLSSTFAPSSLNTSNTFNTRSPFSLGSKPSISIVFFRIEKKIVCIYCLPLSNLTFYTILCYLLAKFII